MVLETHRPQPLQHRQYAAAAYVRAPPDLAGQSGLIRLDLEDHVKTPAYSRSLPFKSKALDSEFHAPLTGSFQELDVSLRRIPEAFRLSYQDVQNTIQKTATNLSELDNNVFKSSSKWADKLRGLGWIFHEQIQQKPNLKFILVFMSAWQKEQLRLYRRDLVCIDSTHNTTSNFPSVGSNKVSTFTLLIRHPDTGRGLPVGWFMTTDETA